MKKRFVVFMLDRGRIERYVAKSMDEVNLLRRALEDWFQTGIVFGVYEV